MIQDNLNTPGAGGMISGRIFRPSCRRCGGLVDVGRAGPRGLAPMCPTCFQGEQARSSARATYNCSPFRPLSLG